MTVSATIQQHIRLLLADVTGLAASKIPVEHPDAETHGDYASAVSFQLAKQRKQQPAAVAAALADKLNAAISKGGTPLDRAVAAGPFVNLWLSAAYLEEQVAEALEPRPQPAPSGAPTIVEYCGVNIGKPFSIGHLRSTVNGDAIANLLAATGRKVVRMNYLGDWGTQFGKLIVGWKKWGDAAALESDPVRELVRVYVKFHEEADRDPDLVEQGRAWFRKLETKDPEATKLWQTFREASLRNADAILAMLEVTFDEVSGEAQYADKLDGVLQLLTKKKLLSKSKGATIVDLEAEKLPPLLLQKTDEGSLYATRELAAAIDRYERYHFDEMLYEVGIEQELHFRQVFATLRKAGLPWAGKLEHVPHNLYAVGGKKMSTRAGRVADMKEILDEAITRADKVIAAKNPDLKDRATVARQVGIGAVKYHDLSQSRLTTIEFDFDRMLSLEGNSAPYLQYTHARVMSVLARAGLTLEQVRGLTPPAASAAAGANAPEEQLLRRRLVRFDEAVTLAAERRMPHVLATELYELATRFNAFYATQPILKADEPARTARLRLAAAVASLLARGLVLLGIHAPAEM
ncbi:MAG: arginine--tRNA ligase [Candidatus Andersenbacteria bacterium]